MKSKVYSFSRTHDPSRVHDALRVLKSAGISPDQIKVLSPTPGAERTSLSTPDGKRLIFGGGWLGLMMGALLGAMIFVLPKFIWDYAYENELAVVGFVISLGVGVSVGVLQALMTMRRQSGSRILGKDEHGVFVTIHDGQEEEKLNRAKDELNRLDFATF